MTVAGTDRGARRKPGGSSPGTWELSPRPRWSGRLSGSWRRKRGKRGPLLKRVVLRIEPVPVVLDRLAGAGTESRKEGRLPGFLGVDPGQRAGSQLHHPGL